MALWTISAETGTGGLEVARELAARTGVPLLDRAALAVVARELEPGLGADPDELEERICSRLSALALGVAASTGQPDAVRELRLRRNLPELARTVLRMAARQPAVVLAQGAFAALRDHPAGTHVRLRAPFAWRVAELQRRDLVPRERAERLLRHEDQLHRAFVRMLYHVDVDDPAQFSLVLDVSRFPRERVVATLLAAAATPAAG